jgi:hypothetical protein
MGERVEVGVGDGVTSAAAKVIDERAKIEEIATMAAFRLTSIRSSSLSWL